MTFRFKSESDAWATINALRVAATDFEESIKACPELAVQFTRQAETVRRIADEIEQET